MVFAVRNLRPDRDGACMSMPRLWPNVRLRARNSSKPNHCAYGAHSRNTLSRLRMFCAAAGDFLEAAGELVADLLAHAGGDLDAAGLGQRLGPSNASCAKTR